MCNKGSPPVSETELQSVFLLIISMSSSASYVLTSSPVCTVSQYLQLRLQPENLIKRNFTASKPNEKWLTDITQVNCKDGKLYIAPIFDCFSGEIISLAMDRNMKKELCISALEAAFKVRKPRIGVIIHSDAGSQYTSEAYKSTIGKYHGIQSMSDVGKCYDNARMESFFATLKKEKLYKIKTEKMTVEQVKTAVFRYIMVYYNRKRITTVNPGGLPPSIYRERFEAQFSVA